MIALYRLCLFCSKESTIASFFKHLSQFPDKHDVPKKRKLGSRTKFLYSKYFNDKVNENLIYDDLNSKEENIVTADLLSMKNELLRPKSSFRMKDLGYRGEILFGIHPVYLALLAKKRQFHQVFIRRGETSTGQPENSAIKDEIEKHAILLGIPLRNATSRDLNFLAPGAVHQGVCLDAEPLPLPEYTGTTVSELSNQEQEHKPPLWLVLDQILDPMNVGAIIRSAYYFGVQKIFIVRGHSCKLSPTVSKASSGALEVMDISQLTSLEDFILDRKSNEWSVISTVSNTGSGCLLKKEEISITDVADYQISKPSILILGNEGKGISSSIMQLCDAFITIHPKQNLHHGIDSLNVSVAAGVILHSISASRDRR